MGRLCPPVSLSACCCCHCSCPPPPPPPNPPSLLYSRNDGVIDTQVGIVAPFAYSTRGVASRIFHTAAKNTNKKNGPADSQSDEGAGSSRRLFIFKRRPPLVSETSPPGTRLVLLSHGKRTPGGFFRQRPPPTAREM